MVGRNPELLRNALSVDVEDYFMVENFASRISFNDWDRYTLRLEQSVPKLLNCFNAHKVKATFFTLGWVAEKLPQLIRQIASEGHEIACHGYSHRPVAALGKKTFTEELKKAKQILEDISGYPVTGFRAATYSVSPLTPWVWDTLIEKGFQYDSSYRPFLHKRWPGMPVNEIKKIRSESGKEIVEFPISVKKYCGLYLPVFGGGYFRLFPLSCVERGIKKMNALGQAANIYLHPWEVDPDQPVIPSGWVNRFRHRVLLNKTLCKLDSLLGRFEFAPVKEVVFP